MTNRFKGSMAATAAVAALFCVGLRTVAGQAPAAAAQPYAQPRTLDGQPDVTGIWQALNSAAWDLEDHSPRLGVPGGFGVVEGGRIPYLPAALSKKKQNFEKRSTEDPESKCYLPGVPRITFLPFPFQILQFPDSAVIVYEYRGITRTIPFRGQHPDPQVIDFWMGDSRARWDGNTLVVDTGNFNEETWLDRAGNFHSDELHVVERYTRTGPDHMTYEVTIEDPKVFSRPWKMSTPLYRRQEKSLRLLEYECYAYMEEEAAKGNVKLPWSRLEFEGVPQK